MVAFSPDFTGFLSQYEIECVARNVPPAVPGETFDVISDGVPRSHDLSVFYRVHFSDTLDLAGVKANLEAVACVESVAYWPVAVLFSIGVPDDPGTPVDSTFLGPFYDQLSDEQWYLKAPDASNPGGIDVEGAWAAIWEELTTPPWPDVVVAIIDGSFGTELHIDLQASEHDDSRIEYDSLPWGAHGTWVSGVASAAASNIYERGGTRSTSNPPTVGLGITGVAPTLEVILTGHPRPFSGVKGLEQFGYLLYNADTKPDVINFSWGFPRDENATMRALTEVAFFNLDIVLVAAAGNIPFYNPVEFDAYPAKYDYVISVGASTPSAGWASGFSNYGPDRVDMLAPGVSIFTTAADVPQPTPPPETIDEHGWSTKSGTSLSAPMVTGIVALMKVANPQLPPATIQAILAESCNQPAGFAASYNDTTGHGIINARTAVTRAKQLKYAVCDLPGDANSDCYVNYGDVSYLDDYLYGIGDPPEYPNNADVNGDCSLDMADVAYLINFIFMDGPDPQPGCVVSPKRASDDPGAPTETSLLAQNYPNPFNPTTTIRFDLARTSTVNLKIYNVLGQRIATLVDGRLASGEHVIQWDGRNSSGQRVASGFYLYRLNTDGKVTTRKMLLLK